MTAGQDSETEKVVVECEMEASSEKLWRALTEEELVSEWLGARPARASDRQQENRPSFRIVDAEPYRRVCYAWHDPEAPDAPPLVTIELGPMPNGNTWFRLIHGEPAACSNGIVAANTNRPAITRAA